MKRAHTLQLNAHRRRRSAAFQAAAGRMTPKEKISFHRSNAMLQTGGRNIQATTSCAALWPGLPKASVPQAGWPGSDRGPKHFIKDLRLSLTRMWKAGSILTAATTLLVGCTESPDQFAGLAMAQCLAHRMGEHVDRQALLNRAVTIDLWRGASNQ